MMLYFAYGSNMDWNQMRSRCPSAKFCGIAVLKDYKFTISRFSDTRKCGVADAVPEKGGMVWGVVYELPDQEIALLDVSEGFYPGRKIEKNAYRREQRHVYFDDNPNKPIAIEIYFATIQPNPPPPNQEYKNLIIGGARFWHLPESYIVKTLSPIEVLPG